MTVPKDATPMTQGSSQTLTAFLHARIAEDEAAARAATPSPWTVDKKDDESEPRWGIDGPVPEGGKWPAEVVDVSYDRDYYNPLGGCETAETAAHIARHDPARVLAECEAKRRIVESRRGISVPTREVHDEVASQRDYVFRCLALPYADHPDYREEWRP